MKDELITFKRQEKGWDFTRWVFGVCVIEVDVGRINTGDAFEMHMTTGEILAHSLQYLAKIERVVFDLHVKQDTTVPPLCEFIKEWIQRHMETIERAD